MTALQTGVGSGILQVFVSYKRNSELDQKLAGEIVAALSARGHAVFIDQRLKIGQDWAREIEERVRQSDFLIVLLTEASSASEMVRGEVEIARKAAQESGTTPKILPVRVAFTDPLPYPLNAYLDHIQYALWKTPADTPAVLEALQLAMTGEDVPSPQLAAATPDTGARAPAYAAMLPPPGGAIDVDDPFYVQRSVDRSAAALAAQPGQTVIIKGPRQMGKSSLLMRFVSGGVDAGKKAVVVDLQLVDGQTRSNAESFFQWFAGTIAEQLQLDADPVAHWDARSPTTQNCTSFFDKRVLARVPEPIMLAIDESDVAFRTTFGSDFFSMLRNWHGRRANPVMRAWKRVDLVLVTAVEPDQLIDRPYESPFNVGITHVMEDFTLEQVQSLNARHPRPLDGHDLETVFRLVGGHPYLVRRALYLTAGPDPRTSVPHLARGAVDEMGPFGDHLRYYMLRILGKKELLQALRDALAHGTVADDSLGYRLQACGLLRRDGAKLVARCDLYDIYFRMRLGLGR